MIRVALFTPLPPQPTGVATFTSSLLAPLSQLVDLRLFTDSPDHVSPELQTQFPIRAIDSFQGIIPEQIDCCLYQMGNNRRFHQQIYDTLCRWPGVTVLHDLIYNDFYGDLWLAADSGGAGRAAFTQEMGYGYGEAGIVRARQAHRGETDYGVADYPLRHRLLDLSLGVILHSPFARQRCLELRPGLNTAVIPLAAPPVNRPDPATARAALGVSADQLLLGSLGHVAPEKRLLSALQAVARLAPDFPDLRYLIAGAAADQLAPAVTELGLTGMVQLRPDVDDTTYSRCLAAIDIGLNLRHPTRGESSGPLIQLLAAGTPVLVSNTDAFADLPHSCCPKVGVGPDEIDDICRQLRPLLSSPERRQAAGAAARQRVADFHQPAPAAAAYADFLHQIQQQAISRTVGTGEKI